MNRWLQSKVIKAMTAKGTDYSEYLPKSEKYVLEWLQGRRVPIREEFLVKGKEEIK